MHFGMRGKSLVTVFLFRNINYARLFSCQIRFDSKSLAVLQGALPLLVHSVSNMQSYTVFIARPPSLLKSRTELCRRWSDNWQRIGWSTRRNTSRLQTTWRILACNSGTSAAAMHHFKRSQHDFIPGSMICWVWLDHDTKGSREALWPEKLQ